MKILPDGIDLSDSELQVLKHDLLNIEDWLRSALNGKIASCRSRMINEWTPKLLDDDSINSLPANVNALISLITSNVNYKTRAERELEYGSTIN